MSAERPSAEPALLGLDIGLTTTKAGVVTARGVVLEAAERPVSMLTGADGGCERDLAELWDACVRVCAEAVARSGRLGRVDAMGVTAHGDGVILCNADGVPLGPAALSLDRRAADLTDRLVAAGIAAGFRRATGQSAFPGRAPMLLLWLTRHRPELVEVSRWALFTKDWVKLRLTGRATTDFTDASGGLLDLGTGDYAAALLVSMGLASVVHRLPPVVRSDRPAGRITTQVARALGLPPGIPVASGLHDLSAAMVGAGALAAGPVVAVAGTWSIDAAVGDDPTGSEVTRRLFVDGRSRLRTSSSPLAGGVLRWLAGLLAPESPGPVHVSGRPADPGAGDVAATTVGWLLERHRREMTTPSDLTFVPAVAASPAAADDCGALVGFRPSHNAAHLCRAALEGLAFQHRLGIERLALAGPPAEVRATGGLVRSPLWPQLLADALGVPVVTMRATQAGVVGAAVVAAVAAGVHPDLPAAVTAMVHPASRFAPASDSQKSLERNYTRYRDVQAALRPRPARALQVEPGGH